MQPDRSLWSQWARFLQQRGLGDAAAFVLETGGPLTVLAAQLIYLGQPFLSGSGQGGPWQSLANLLEDQTEMKSFAAFLREEDLH